MRKTNLGRWAPDGLALPGHCHPLWGDTTTPPALGPPGGPPKGTAQGGCRKVIYAGTVAPLQQLQQPSESRLLADEHGSSPCSSTKAPDKLELEVPKRLAFLFSGPVELESWSVDSWGTLQG